MTLDIKTAFLLAPTSQGELIVVRPPKILQEAGLTAAVSVDASFAPEDQHGISGLAEALFNAPGRLGSGEVSEISVDPAAAVCRL